MRLRLLAGLLVLAASAGWSQTTAGVCGTRPDLPGRLLALHRYWAAPAAAGAAGTPEDRDVDGVALLVDRSDLVAHKDPFDLAGTGLRLAPNRAGGYDPIPLALAPDGEGAPLTVGDGEARQVSLPFSFPFFGQRYDSVFVEANGALAFGSAAPGEPDLAGFLSGPPRIAVLFAGLSPSRGGRVTARLTTTRASFLWTQIPGATQINQNTFEASLDADGSIELVWGRVDTREAVVGVSPGGTLDLAPADLSAGLPHGAGGALVERFSESDKLDLVSVARRFYRSHPDAFDQLVVYTTRSLNPVPGTLAFELNVRNQASGIGLDVFDNSAHWGSRSVLASVVFMDWVDRYLATDAFEILGHEVGHRWLARARFEAARGGASDALLGRDGVHWSFFLDTDASVMDGNEIQDLGGGRFLTVDFARRFSPLDQYLMGLRAPAEVPDFFYVDEADDFRPNQAFKSSSPPEAGVSFTGLRREVTIDEVVAALGPRRPEAALAPRVLRQAFVLVADAEAPATAERLAAVARIRRDLVAWYRQATDSRGEIRNDLP